MSTPVTYVGVQYNVPAYQDTGYAQGSGNLSSYLIALATGSLTLSGGSFPLTADVNFGSSFGLLAKYFTSVSVGPSTTGVFRLANNEGVGWRNAAGGADVILKVNTSNQLSYDGGDFILPAGYGFVVTTPNGTQTHRIYVNDNGELTTIQLT